MEWSTRRRARPAVATAAPAAELQVLAPAAELQVLEVQVLRGQASVFGPSTERSSAQHAMCLNLARTVKAIIIMIIIIIIILA